MSTIINVQNNDLALNVVNENITLNIESGGLIAVSQDLQLTASVSLSALRAVTTNSSGQAIYASNDTLANAQVVGITLGAANAGEQVGVKTFGPISDANWNWAKGAVYLGTNGQLTQTAPSGGAIIVQVGRALTATQLFVDVDTTITTV